MSFYQLEKNFYTCSEITVYDKFRIANLVKNTKKINLKRLSDKRAWGVTFPTGGNTSITYLLPDSHVSDKQRMKLVRLLQS